MTKRQQMKIACSFANTTIVRFAKSNGVTGSAVHHALNGKPSKDLSKKIDGFIADQFARYNLTSGNARQRAA